MKQVSLDLAKKINSKVKETNQVEDKRENKIFLSLGDKIIKD